MIQITENEIKVGDTIKIKIGIPEDDSSYFIGVVDSITLSDDYYSLQFDNGKTMNVKNSIVYKM